MFELGQSHYCLAKANLKNNQAEDALTHLIEYVRWHFDEMNRFFSHDGVDCDLQANFGFRR